MHTPQAYLGIASSLAVVATFAGGFTYGNVITLQTNSSTCNVDDDTSTLLSIAFILFPISLFVTILIQVNLRAYNPAESLQDNHESVHKLVQILFLLSEPL
ncbi:hypothetical protein LTR72_011662 [Exophiala xenobiotica]|nr:hypothetical protein LTR72_011662 [Exophiala xenobiotica]KAK5466259.1 hypothetical protein LTR55_011622 [Exophiala xenobiotica]